MILTTCRYILTSRYMPSITGVVAMVLTMTSLACIGAGGHVYIYNQTDTHTVCAHESDSGDIYDIPFDREQCAKPHSTIRSHFCFAKVAGVHGYSMLDIDIDGISIGGSLKIDNKGRKNHVRADILLTLSKNKDGDAITFDKTINVGIHHVNCSYDPDHCKVEFFFSDKDYDDNTFIIKTGREIPAFTILIKYCRINTISAID